MKVINNSSQKFKLLTSHIYLQASYIRHMLLLLLLLCGGAGSVAWAASYQYTYIVINFDHEISTQAKETQAEGGTPVIPTVIKTNLVSTYHYWAVGDVTQSGTTYTVKGGASELASLPSSNATIYMTYDYDNASSPIDLSGETIYYIKDTNPNNTSQVHYLTYNKKYQSADWRFDGSTNGDDNFGDNDKERQWVYEGNDPYKIYLRNVYRRDAGENSYLRSNLGKNVTPTSNGDLRYGTQTRNNLFNTYFFDTSNHIVAANNTYKWENNTNKYIYLYKGNKTSYGDIGGRFWITGDGNMDLNTLNITSPAIADVTIHLVNEDTHNVTCSFQTIVDTSNPKPSAYIQPRLTRLGATLGTTYYKEVALTNAITTPLDVTDIYIPYTVDAATLSDTYNITFSTEENPVWFSMVCTRNGGKQMVYNSNANEISSNQGGSTARAQAVTGQYAFIGDPYSFRVITKSVDREYAYVDTEDNNKVRFSDTPEEWALVSGTADGTFQIFRRDDFLSTYRSFWDAYSGGNQIRMTAQSSGNDIIANHNIKATKTPKYNYIYNIVDKSGRIAIKYTVSQYASTRLDGEHGHEAIPEAIYSPYLEGETLTFYSTLSAEGSRDNLSNPITVTPASDDIYVSYTTGLLNTRSLSIDGSSSLSVKVGSKYVKYENSAIGFADALPARGSAGYDTELPKFVWNVVNSDPYDVGIRKTIVESTYYYMPGNDGTNIHFILMAGSDPDNGQQVELILASGENVHSDAESPTTTSQSLNCNGSILTTASTVREAPAQQVVFADASTKVFYRIIDKQGKIVVEYEQENASGTPAVNADWSSPLVSHYHYWKRSNFIEVGGTYTLKSGLTSEDELKSVSDVADGYIYVTYDVADNNIITQVDPTARVHQNGSATGALVRDYENSWGQIFMIKFADGEEFYQEKSDALRDTKMKAIYPYANGDSGFNLYGEEKWDEDRVGGSSTRTRWSWYVLSENNDPYHVKITSWQGSNSRTLSGDDVSTSYYNFWRTYYNSEVGAGGSIVTGTISDDPQVRDESKTGGSADNIPTEYMLLGTTHNYKLVTTNEITGVADHATYGKHRPVRDFLQYWKTWETISREGKNPDGTPLRADVFQSQAVNPYSYFSTENVTAHPVYNFNAWHNARPITESDPPYTKNNKKYEYANHYYQKINLGETFDLVEHSIDGIMILLDNHGWEIMRKPMAKTGDANKASRDAAIRQFDSPMVKTYHFWSAATKANGYHRYIDLQTDKGTGSSLGDYPEVINSNGNISDLYVTYEVKPEYAELYTVTATKDGSGKVTAVSGAVVTGKTFIIRQDSKLAYDNSGTLAADGTAENITKIDTGQPLTGLDAKYYWYLAPNWDIDKEMGYVYNTGTKTDGKENEDYYITSDNQYLPRTETETRIAYYKTDRAGFDPYNIQIYNQSTNNYFTTNASDSRLDEYNAMKATFTDKNVTLAAKNPVNTSVNNGEGHDDVNLHMTNQTFMVISDANGNMRLMPRFDHYNSIENFIELEEWAADQPEDDKTHGQSTWLLRPPAHVYIVVDNEGNEALRYTALSDGAPTIPAKYRSPLAENFTFYKAATYNEETHKYTLDNNNLITGSFTENNVADEAIIYVRYQYNPDADKDQLLYGTWYKAQLNASDIKVITNDIDLDTYADDAAHHVRFKKSAGDGPDPYAVTLWNGEETQKTDGRRYIVFRHSDYTNVNRSYALMKAGNTTNPTTDYYFLDGSSDPATFVEQSGYTTNGVIGEAKKLTLTKVAATNRVTFKIITNTGKVALTSESVDVDANTNLSTAMPLWLKTPIMEDDAYVFHSAATERLDGTYDIKGVPTTSPTTLDGDVVYVRYDYEKSKKAITSFGTETEEVNKDKFDGLPYNYAPLDLTGKVAYTIGNTSTELFKGKLWSINSNAIIKPGNDDNVAVNTELTKDARLWYFTGNDPYEVTIKNPAHNTTKVLAGKMPDLDADWDTTPNERYPLVTMMEPNDETYKLNTFMVLKYNPNEKTGKVENISHCAGTLKLYITGNDRQYLAESNSLAGGVYIYTDELHYKERLEASSEPINPKNNTMIIYSSFFYRPVMTYHIITNNKKEALKGYSLMANTTVEMPEVYQSPLLNSSDFTYYTKANVDGSNYTIDKDASTTASTTIASLAAQKIGDIYVRYNYNRDTSPFKIATNINDAAEDGTRLSWIDEKGLDLSGKTWYTIANMQRNFATEHGRVFGAETDNTTRFRTIPINNELPNSLPNGRAPSQKEYLWKLEGNDPYAIKICNAQHNKCLSVNNSTYSVSLLDTITDGNSQTFMLLEAHAIDNQASRLTNYELSRWTVLMTTGTNYFTPCTTDGTGETSNLSARDTWVAPNYSNYDIRMSSGEVVPRKVLSMGSGSTTRYCIEFVKAPVTRKYHYYAVNQATGKVTWDAIMEHDWLQDVVLEPIIARRYCKYEARNTEATGDNVTGTNDFQTQYALENNGVKPNAQFYSDPGLTKRVKDTKSGKYDIYPEIELEEVYPIYFKYQVDNEATLNLAGSAKTLSQITSTTEQIAADVAHYNNQDYTDNADKEIKEANGRRLEPGYTQQAKWFYMVLDTDEDITTTVDGDTRTPVGRQLFLRREDNGTVNWMNNIYTLHKESVDNYKGWSYDRLAESYRKGDNDAFREGRWLWTFVGDDPYNMRIINLESAVGVQAESSGVYSLAAADNCFVTINKGTTTSGDDTYPITIPTEEPTENQYWGLCVGVNNSDEQTFSLLSTAITETIDNEDVSLPLYWHMVSHTVKRVTTESVEGMLDYIPDRSYAIQLLPYDPQRYEDVKVVIRRDDEVNYYNNTWKAGKTEAQKLEYVNNTMTTGISKLYFSASERKYMKNDEINTSEKDALPLQVRRAFCDYTMYSDLFETDNTIYTVQAGPYPDYSKPKTGQFDEDGHQIYAYYNVDGSGNFTGDEVTSGAQAIYVKYVVNSDIFLKTAPAKTQVEEMAQNNDHVYFMDFPDTSGKDTYHHAYYDPSSTMREKTGDLKTQRDTHTGTARPEKRKLSGTDFIDDTDDWYNHYQYRTTHNRMESVPQNLKWYFVGDPYKMQVFNVAGAWNAETLKDKDGNDISGKEEGKVAAQLARFNPVETNFQFVVDCVNLRIPNYSVIDEREELQPYKEDGTIDTEAATYHNRNHDKPYFNDFYWECVPTTSKEEGTFALRFKEDNQLLGYRNVYYYLAHDGLSKVYQKKNYSINLSYNADNEQHETGEYAGYHTANDVNTIIKLVQPVKVYVTAHRNASERYAAQTDIVTDELSEYYGLNETISEVPRHLQRKFVLYSALDNAAEGAVTDHKLSIENATSHGTCGTAPYDDTHSQTINDLMTSKVSKEYVDPVFKFTVYYTVDDLSKDEAGNDAHLFTSSAQHSAGTLNWVDMAVLGNGTNWLFFDKTGVDNTKVTNYRTAIGDDSADGWNDGLKGLHWAFVGDPYDFAILNRRRYEDGNHTDVQWLQVVKTHVRNRANTADSVIWVTKMADYDAVVPTEAHVAATAASSIADETVNTHFSTQMWKLPPKNSDGTYKTGNADANYFLRTASLKSSTDDGVNGSATNQTSNYWRLVHKPYPDAANPTSYFEMVPYSLAEKSNYTNTQYMNNYSKTMNGMGVYQQRLEIRTAVAKDEDDADNNCFDADVEIRTLNGVLKLKRSDMEIRYGNIEKALPASLRRYGCSYKCYLNYDPATNSGTEIDNFGELVNEEGYAELHAAMEAAQAAHASDPSKSPRPLLTYVYTVDDATSQFFTTAQDARTEDYTWANSYFYWEQKYTGSSVEVEKTRLVFDHYVYNSDGKIIDEVWREESYTEVVNNPTTPYPTKGYLNTHTSQTPVYADQTVQKSDNEQKWSMTGDPYGFTMKNYAQYLNNTDAIVSMSGTDVITQNYGDGQTFAYVVDKKGTPYLAIINNNPDSPTYGNIVQLVDFEFSSTSNKTLMSVGNGINTADATGNSLATTYTNSSGKTATVKPFYLTNLMSYADMVVYHLVMAHQYSLDSETRDHLSDAQKTDVDKRMMEFLMYWGIQEHSDKDYFVETYTDGVPTAYKTLRESDIKTLLKEKGTLRNFLSYPVEDAIVERVGVDNKPQVPWYMKRQFCTYHIYQHDVQRSVVDNTHPSFQQVDDEWTGKTCTIVLGRTYKDYNNDSYTADEAFVTYYAGQIFKSNDGTNPIPMTFIENGVTKQAFNVKWESIFDKSSWTVVSESDLAAKPTDGERTAAGWENVSGTWRKIPSGYTDALALQGVEIDKIYTCHQNRKIFIDVIYEVNPNHFRFAQKGRNTTAWYQMMTNNETADGLLNFSYKDGIGGRLDRTHHYTNNYLWAPEGDPYGFVLRSRYATINGTGFDDVAVTTEGKLPKGEDQWGNPIYKSTDGGVDEPFNEPTVAESKASYTGASSASTIPFDHKRIIHRRAGQDDATTDGATNAVYEMFIGGYDDSFLMHPTSAWMDKDDVDHESYYMVHNTTTDGDYQAHRAYLRKYKPDDLRYLPDANWRLECTNEQLIPYFKRAGYVGGLKPTVAQNFTNQEYYNRLKNGDTFSFADLTKLQDLVYGGKFYLNNSETEIDYATARPTTTGTNGLPLRFVPNNLVSMTNGYYRIKAFSEDALNTDGNDLAGSGTNIKGITGPRYISGYRFESAKSDPNDANNNGGRWLHFLETDMTHSDIHTYADLLAKIAAVDAEKGGSSDRDQIAHSAMSGNIEILPADFDPSSIFQFTDVSESDSYTRYNIKTQNLTLWARPGGTEGLTEPHQFGRTELVESTPSAAEGYTSAESPGGWDNKFRLEDIGGAATTIRVRNMTDANWDVMVAQNLKTNYICIDRNHRYRITCHTNNEMVEIGDHYTTDGLNGIQDTKWLLQPVGIHEEWPYNEMPLRVEVQKGGVKDQNLTGAELTAEENKDKNYYGSLYVPFDSRLSNTTDAAFTLTNDAKANTTTVTMQSVSQLNGMGNPQYVPAGWPVVIRTSLPGSITLKNQNGTEYATKHYVNMYLPYATPQTGLDDEKAQIKLRGEYLERTLTNSYIDGIESKTIMVFGLPFADHDNTHHEYARTTKQVGWYTNENWARETYPQLKAHTGSYAATGTIGTVATDPERDNKYVYHNKVYYPYTLVGSAKKRHIVAIFDGNKELEEEENPEIPEDPEIEQTTDSNPWPCDVYDLSGRRVARNETPETLRHNHPGLPKGIYIFGTKKVVVK